ncbi:hypothetical protein [Micromonospora sp. NPDC093277]|uniref:hypothetical protein n=1 Tax=Micromonospora sp. NPDC093277 TaxID=3364291 RepID=UPI0037F2E305
MRQRIRWWKVLGLAGLAGVAATGVVVARAERRRRAYTPDEIHDRLRERHARATGPAPDDQP